MVSETDIPASGDNNSKTTKNNKVSGKRYLKERRRCAHMEGVIKADSEGTADCHTCEP